MMNNLKPCPFCGGDAKVSRLEANRVYCSSPECVASNHIDVWNEREETRDLEGRLLQARLSALAWLYKMIDARALGIKTDRPIRACRLISHYYSNMLKEGDGND